MQYARFYYYLTLQICVHILFYCMNINFDHCHFFQMHRSTTRYIRTIGSAATQRDRSDPLESGPLVPGFLQFRSCRQFRIRLRPIGLSGHSAKQPGRFRHIWTSEIIFCRRAHHKELPCNRPRGFPKRP